MPATLNSFNLELTSKPVDDSQSMSWPAAVSFNVSDKKEDASQTQKDGSIVLGHLHPVDPHLSSARHAMSGKIKFRPRNSAAQAQKRLDGSITVNFEAVIDAYTPSKFQINVNFGFKNPQTGVYQDSRIVVVLDAYNMEQQATVVPVTQEMCKDLQKMFPHIADLAQRVTNTDEEKPKIYQIQISHDGDKRGIALHCRHSLGEPNTSRFDLLSSIMSKPGTVTILCNLRNDDIIKKTNLAISENIARAPLLEYFIRPKKGENLPTFHHKQMLRDKAERPVVKCKQKSETDSAFRYPNVRPQASFVALQEYLGSYLVATEIDWEAMDELKRTVFEVKIRFYDQGDAQKTGMRRVFGSVEPVAGFDIKEGDQIKLYWDKGYEEKTAYTGRRIRANYFTALSDMSFIFNAPIDPATGLYIEHDFGKDIIKLDELEADTNSARSAFRDARAVTCFAATESSDKPLAHHFSAGQKLYTDREKDENVTKWLKTLSGNDVNLEQAVNLYRDIPEEILAACHDVFNESQKAAPAEMKALWCKMLLVLGPPGTGKTEVLIRLMLPFVVYGIPSTEDPSIQLPSRLFCGSTLNRSATKIVKRLREICREPKIKLLISKYRGRYTDLMFIRGFATHTEKKIYRRDAQVSRNNVKEPTHISVHQESDGEEADMDSDGEDRSGEQKKARRHKMDRHSTKTDFVPGQPLSPEAYKSLLADLDAHIRSLIQRRAEEEEADNEAGFAGAKPEKKSKTTVYDAVAASMAAEEKLDELFRCAWGSIGAKACTLHTQAVHGDKSAAGELRKAASDFLKQRLAYIEKAAAGASAEKRSEREKAAKKAHFDGLVADKPPQEDDSRAPEASPDNLLALEKAGRAKASAKASPQNVILTRWKQDAFRTHLVDDERVTDEDLEDATGTHMLRVAGRLKKADGSLYSYADEDQHAIFNTLLDQYAAGDEFDATKMQEFTAAAKKLMEDTISKSDVFVSTLFAAGSSPVYTALTALEDSRPREYKIAFVDELAKAVEPDLWPLLAWLGSEYVVGAGDPKQVCGRTFTQNNPLAQQMSMSPMARCEIVGMPTVRLTIQHRMNSSICSPISDSFYDSLLTTHPAVDSRPTAKAARDFSFAEFGVRSNVVLIDVQGGVEQRLPGATSYFNYDNVRVISHLVELMLKSKTFKSHFKPEDIVVLSGYAAQTDLHNRANDERISDDRLKGSQDVGIFNIDSIQGEEAAVVILDITRTDALGFLASPNRINMALSRARDLLIVVGCLGKLRAVKSFKHFAIGRFVEELKSQKVTHRIVPSSCDPVTNPNSELFRHYNMESLEQQQEARRAAMEFKTAANPDDDKITKNFAKGGYGWGKDKRKEEWSKDEESGWPDQGKESAKEGENWKTADLSTDNPEGWKTADLSTDNPEGWNTADLSTDNPEGWNTVVDTTPLAGEAYNDASQNEFDTVAVRDDQSLYDPPSIASMSAPSSPRAQSVDSDAEKPVDADAEKPVDADAEKPVDADEDVLSPHDSNFIPPHERTTWQNLISSMTTQPVNTDADPADDPITWTDEVIPPPVPYIPPHMRNRR